MNRPTPKLLAALFLLALAPFPAAAQRYIGDLPPLPKIEAPPLPVPSVPRREGSTIVFGNVVLDELSKTVTATGWVNQTRGLIEVFACGPRGKTHESAFVLDANPFDLQAALLATGLKAGEPMPAFGEGPPHGSPVDIFLSWPDPATGATNTARAETFVMDVEQEHPLAEGPWTFTGSVVIDGRFMAIAEETYIASFWDPYAIVNNPLPSGVNDDILFVNTNAIPPYGTPVTFSFRPAPAPHPLAATNHMAPEVPRIRYGF